MVEPLTKRLLGIRRQVRRSLWLYGLCSVISVVAALIFCVGLLDWLFHFDDSGIRFILLIAIAAVASWTLYRFLVVPLKVPLSEVDIAYRIEDRYPGLKDRLSSTLQFLKQGTDPRIGSPTLQMRVIRETLAQLGRVNIADVVDTRSTWRATLTALAIVASMAAVAGLNRADAGIALHRLLLPFSERSWPRTTQLQLVNADLKPIPYDRDQPLRIARGDHGELFVRNAKGDLPTDLLFEQRLDSTESPSRTEYPMRRTTLETQTGKSIEVGVIPISSELGSQTFRATGGDDDLMPWYRLNVLPPPEITGLQITLLPPVYTGLPRESLSPDVGHVQGLVGTRVEIEADCNSPLARGVLQIQDGKPQPLEISDDGQRFKTAFVIDRAGLYHYGFQLTDTQGMTNRRAPKYDVRGIADLVPSIAIESPDADRSVTADAEIALSTVAHDDLGLKDIRLNYTVEGPESSSADEIVVPLYSSPENSADRIQDKRVQHVWRLSELPLADGTRIRYRTEASDFSDFAPPHIGRSFPQTLTVVSDQQKTQELLARQYDLVENLEQSAAAQRRTRDQVDELQTQWEQMGQMRRADMDLLHRTELDQRRIADELAKSGDGLQHQARGILQEFHENHLNDPEATRQLERFSSELDRLEREHLPRIEQNLSRASKAVRLADTDESSPAQPDKPGDDSSDEETPGTPNHNASDTAPSEALAAARDHQQSVIDSLDELVQELGTWRDRQNLIGELDSIVNRQQEISEATADVAKSTITKSLAELTEQQRTELSKVANQEQELADQIERFRRGMEEMQKELAESDPQSADAVAEAADQLDRRAIVGRTREISRQLAANNTGQAAEGQQQLQQDLESMGQALRGRMVDDSETLARKLGDAQQDLEMLRKQQQQLADDVAEAANIDEDAERAEELQTLRKQQERLSEQAEGAARKVERLKSRSSGQSLRRAAGQMRQAEDHLGANQAPQAQDRQQEAMDDLEQAQRELAAARRHAEEQLARELLGSVTGELSAMIARQTTVVETTNRLEESFRERGNWSRAQLKTLRDLADDQRGLQQETERLREKLAATEIFALAIRGAAQNMQQAADRLLDRKTDDQTVYHEAAAIRRFEDMLESFKPEPKQAPNGGDAGEPNPADRPAAENAGSDTPPPSLAELKMLKALQVALRERTERIGTTINDREEFSQDELAELEDMALQQEELADLARNLTPAFVSPFEVEPADTPDE